MVATLVGHSILIAIAAAAAVAIPNRLAEEVRLEVAWITELDTFSSTSTMWTPVLLEQQELLPVWREPELMYLHPVDGHIVERREYTLGAAFTQRFHASAETEAGVVQVRSPAGRMQFSLSGNGRVVLRQGMQFIVSPYANEVWGFSNRGEYLWRKQFADILTVVESVQDHALLGTASGEMLLVSPDGTTQSLRAVDGNPILGIASRERVFWVIVDGETLLLEKRNIDEPNTIQDAILLPGQGPMRRNIQMRVGRDTLFIPQYGLLLLGDEEILQLPAGTDFFDIPGTDISLHTAASPVDGYRRFSLMDMRSKKYAVGTAGAAINIQQRDSGFLLWDNQWAVYYRLRRKAE